MVGARLYTPLDAKVYFLRGNEEGAAEKVSVAQRLCREASSSVPQLRHSSVHMCLRLETEIMEGVPVEDVIGHYDAEWEAIQADLTTKLF